MNQTFSSKHIKHVINVFLKERKRISTIYLFQIYFSALRSCAQKEKRTEEEELLYLLYLVQKRKWRRRCVRPLHVHQVCGESGTLACEMRSIDPEKHHQYFRMSAARFDNLARRISVTIIHKRTHQAPISVEERLAVTLRYLATGASQVSVATDLLGAPYQISSPKFARPSGRLSSPSLSRSHTQVNTVAHQRVFSFYGDQTQL